MSILEARIDAVSRPHAVRSRRRWIFVSLTLLLVAVLLELGSTGLLAFFSGRVSHRDTQRRISSGDTWEAMGQVEVLHPFLGYVHDPNELGGVNQFGFTQMDAELPRRSPDRLVVGVTGGSVAMLLCQLGGETLRDELQARFPDREIVLSCLAVSGYEQPQQLMAFNYFRCLGAEYDVLINLDGFNEVVMEPIHNPHAVTFDVYPKEWDRRVHALVSSSDTDFALLKLRLLELYETRRKRAAWMLRAPWRWSQTGQLLWWIRDQSLLARARQLEERKHEIDTGREYVKTGPPNPQLDLPGRQDELVDLWYRSSLWLHQVCAAADTTYVHALQPNQYLPDSKQLTAWERIHAYDPQSKCVKLVPQAYPQLRERGVELRSQGVHFVDLTMIFAETSETTYTDKCCHLNELGNELVAAALAAEVAAAVAAREQSAQQAKMRP